LIIIFIVKKESKKGRRPKNGIRRTFLVRNLEFKDATQQVVFEEKAISFSFKFSIRRLDVFFFKKKKYYFFDSDDGFYTEFCLFYSQIQRQEEEVKAKFSWESHYYFRKGNAIRQNHNCHLLFGNFWKGINVSFFFYSLSLMK
jgi:hypothetical protein